MHIRPSYRRGTWLTTCALLIVSGLQIRADDEPRRGAGGAPKGGSPNPNPRKTSCCSPVCSDADLQDGNLTLDYSLSSYRSLNASHAMRFVYNSTTADVRPIIAEDSIANSFVGGSVSSLSGRLMIDGRVVSFPQGTEIFYDGTLASGASVRLALQFDANNLSDRFAFLCLLRFTELHESLVR